MSSRLGSINYLFIVMFEEYFIIIHCVVHNILQFKLDLCSQLFILYTFVL